MSPQMRRCLLLGLALVLASVVACKQVVLGFVHPLPGAEVTWMPLDIEVRVRQSADLSTLAVKLNGHDITAEAEIGAAIDGWHAVRMTRVWDGIVLPGTNELNLGVQTASGSWSERIASFEALGDPYADAVVSVQVGEFGGFPGPSFLPGIVLGPPRGGGLLQGSFDVFSLGFGGEIVLRFDDNVIVDGDGPDFTTFENAFLVENPATLTIERPFADPAFVAVSQDGAVWHEFPCQLVVEPAMGTYYPGCAGVFPVLSHAGQPETPHASIPTDVPLAALIDVSSDPLPDPGGAGGDSFDLAEVGLAWARFVRIRDPDFWTGDPFGATTAGFDLDAVAAIHSEPTIGVNGNGEDNAIE